MLDHLRTRWWTLRARTAAEDGLSLIEVLVAGFVLSIAVLGLASVASASLISIRDSRERDRGTAAASSAIEAVRAMSYDDIALATGDAWSDDPLVQVAADGNHYLDHDGDGENTERVWATGAGAIDPYACTSDAAEACWFDIPTETRVDVRVFVTWYPDAEAQDGKRVTVVARWDDPAFAAPRTVRMSTIVSEAQRGLPVPAFEVLPGQGSLQLDHEGVRDLVDDEDEECLEHTVTNFGADDRYDLVFDDDFVAKSPSTQGTWQNTEWIVRAFFVPVDSDLEKGDAGTLMLADPDGGDFIVESQLGLTTGESARLHVCYAPRTDGDGAPVVAAPYEETFTHTVRSKFDDRVTQTIAHTIGVSGDTFVLYLQDPRLVEAAQDEEIEPQSSYLRPIKSGGAGGYSFDQFTMTTWLPTLSGNPPDYDIGVEPRPDTFIDFTDEADVSPDTRLNRGGLWLPGVTTTFDGREWTHDDFAAVFDHQLPGDTAGMTFTGDVTLEMWASRWPADHPVEGEMCTGVEVVRLNPNGTVDAVVGRGLHVLSAGGGWRAVAMSFPWEPDGPGTGAGDVSFDREEYVRVRVWNAAAEMNAAEPGERSCVDRYHLGYGTSGRPARLVAEPLP